VASSIYRRFAQAMKRRDQIVCLYRGHPHELCPVILGHSAQQEEKVLAWQFAGTAPVALYLSFPGELRRVAQWRLARRSARNPSARLYCCGRNRHQSGERSVC
jgi:hypothetical protein